MGNIIGGIVPGMEIAEAIDPGDLVLNGKADHVSGCSYDMRVGTIVRDGHLIKASADQQRPWA